MASRSPSPIRAHVDDSGKKPLGDKKAGDDGASGSKSVVVERVIKEVGMAAVYPELTRSNYSEWALVMQVNFEAQGLWEAIMDDGVDRREDRQALAALLRAVPAEMRSTLAVKKSAKEAWEAVRTMRLGVDRVKAANAQKLLMEFEAIKFKPGETVDEFTTRINSVASTIRSIGESLDEPRIVKKFLRVVPSRYSQIAVSIKTLLDLDKVTVEELVGRLRASQDRFDEPNTGGGSDEVRDKSGRLMMAEEDWFAKWKHKLQPDATSSCWSCVSWI
ncbi:hypothetical protein U9M48_005594 [Paspalum notatum var. saurae]|uniref:DUF4219 domain-containing protein n=1 Tax=Paspalum notatum var. saurae TaxID=547442 RepID=A0AAQ3PQI9_PASNO